jgi:hypothetical protein
MKLFNKIDEPQCPFLDRDCMADKCMIFYEGTCALTWSGLLACDELSKRLEDDES